MKLLRWLLRGDKIEKLENEKLELSKQVLELEKQLTHSKALVAQRDKALSNLNAEMLGLYVPRHHRVTTLRDVRDLEK